MFMPYKSILLKVKQPEAALLRQGPEHQEKMR